ncbi:MAG: acyl carrier protein [Planctomycetota bacterium]
MTHDEIFEKVQEVLEDALGVDTDEVTEGAVLTTDLGAESIDFLDITFKLEQAFDFKIAQGELFPDGANQDPEFVQDGLVTAKGLESMKNRMPYADLSAFEADPQVSKAADIFTAGMLASFVEHKLAQTAEA